MGKNPKTMIIADPDPDMREMLLVQLTLEGIKVEMASSGVELLQKLYRTGADAIVMEAELPDIEAGRIIDIVKNTARNLPIIIFTANRSKEFEKHIRSRGIFYYATKPFSIELFKIAVRDALASGQRFEEKHMALGPFLDHMEK